MQQTLKTDPLWRRLTIAYERAGAATRGRYPSLTTANQLSLNPSSIACLLAAFESLVLFASIAARATVYITGHDQIYGLVRLFDVDSEQNIPTFFSSSLLLFAAVLLAIVAAQRRKQASSDVSYWAILSFGFFFMAMDEASSIHELFSQPVHELVAGSSVDFTDNAWVIPGIALVLVLGLFFLRFLWHLPAKTRLAFMVAGALYLGGVLGVEMIGDAYHSVHLHRNMTYDLISTVEEGLEMLGAIVFIRALLVHIADHYGEVCFRFDGGRGPLARDDA